MPDARRLLSMFREWPWGLAMLSDPDSATELPAELDASGIGASRSAIAVAILHGIDGPAVAEVWAGSVSTPSTCIYEGEFATESGTIRLSDAGVEESVAAIVGAGARSLRVLVDDRENPEFVVFELESI